jgi:hypothetical protein
MRSPLPLVLTLAACAAPETPDPAAALVPQPERSDGWVVTEIVDARTGLPIEGARLAAIPESHAPLPGVYWEARANEAGEDGIARLAVADLTGELWLLASADGFAPRMQLTRDPGPRLELAPAFDLEVEVRDVFEQPIADAFVSWYAGCGHTPDLVQARTDAAGRARLEGIAEDPGAGDLWLAGPTIDSTGSYGFDSASVILRPDPGVAARGRIVDSDGSPLAGLLVGMPVRHHGPWIRTAADGSFELAGLSPPLEVQVLREADPATLLGTYELPSDGRLVTLTVPPPDPGPTTRVELTLRAQATLEPVADLAVEFVRLPDGRTERRRSDEDGRVEVELPRGTWERILGGGFSGWSRSVSRVRVGEASVAEAITLDPQARWRFRLAQPHPDARVELVTETAIRELTAAELAGDSVPVPREGRCGARVTVGELVEVRTLDGLARRGIGELTLDLPGPRP